MNKVEANSKSDSFQLQLDRGFHYGDGLFETIAVKSGIAELLNEHITRLKISCERLKFINIDYSKITNDIVFEAKNINKGVIKLIVTRGCGGRGYSLPEKMKATYVILHYPWPDYKTSYWQQGIVTKKCNLVLSNQPLLAGMKHLNRLENIMAKMELNNTEYQEGVICDSDDNIIEATSSNVFIVIKNKVMTPKLDRCGVSGVMRDRVITELVKNCVQVDIQDIPFKIALDADEVFLTNSIIGIWPVAKLNERIYSQFSVTKNLIASLNSKNNDSIKN